MLHTAMAVEVLGRRPDAGVGHGNELRHGQQRKHNEKERHSHGLLNDAHQGNNVK